nr:MAG TPA: hypothetical protein [Caudoviricetes sp.]
MFCGIYGRAYEGRSAGEGPPAGRRRQAKTGKDEIPWRK